MTISLNSIILISSLLIITSCANVSEPEIDESKPIQAIEPVNVQNTMLMRLLIKKVHLSAGMDIGRGGAMATLDNKIYVNTNRNNNDDRHHLHIFDMENHFQYEIDEFSVPTNYQNLLSSTFAEADRFVAYRYRVTGLFAESNDDDAHTLFASHMYYEEEENCVSFNVSRTTVGFEGQTARQTSEWEKIFTARPFLCTLEIEHLGYRNPYPGQMHGGKIVSYDDETILVSVGQFSTDPDMFPDEPMDPESSLGKFLLIDKTTGESSPYAFGVRNSQGLFIDMDGTIWSTDHGPQGGDELNIVEEGKNFGFPKETLALQYGNIPWLRSSDQGRHETYDKPVFAWMRSIAPSNLIQIRDDKFPLWRGDLIVSSLGGQSLRRLRTVNENGVYRVLYDEAIDIGNRIRDIVMLPDEKIVLLTDDGSLYIIDDGGPIYEEMEEEVQMKIANLNLYDQLLEGSYRHEVEVGTMNAESIFIMKCASCHNMHETNYVGPHLNNLIGRDVGGLDGYNYSVVLTESNEKWTPDLLRSFLLNQADQFPNTIMPQVLLTPSEADSIINFIRRN